MSFSKYLDPKNDIAFKKIFGSEQNKDILIHFINDIMNFTGVKAIQEVSFLSPVQYPDIAYKKQSLVDVLCKAENGRQIIVEMQVSPNKGFEKKAQYYAAKAYCRQSSEGQKESGLYSNLKEIIFIAISDYIIFPEKSDYISHHVVLDKVTSENDLKDFSFTFVELPKFSVEKIEDLKSIRDKWCYFLKYAAITSEEDSQKLIGKDLIVGRAFDALNQFNWKEAELLAYEQEIKRILDNMATEAYKIESISREIAESLLSQNIDVRVIAQATKISVADLYKLKANMPQKANPEVMKHYLRTDYLRKNKNRTHEDNKSFENNSTKRNSPFILSGVEILKKNKSPSVTIPISTINRICISEFNKYYKIVLSRRKLSIFAIGLGCIPLIGKPIDHLINLRINNFQKIEH